MDISSRRDKTNIYSEEQVRRVITGSGISIESEVDSDCESMNEDLLSTVQSVIVSVNNAFRIASASDEQGIADDLASRDGSLKKIAWQLRSTLKD